jgi:hypothetical protein
MNDMPLTDDQCDRLVAKVMDKLAAKHSDQYGTTHAMDLNPSITEHHTLRRSVVQAAYMLGAMEANALLPENATEPMQKAMQRAVMLRKSMNDVWRAALVEAGLLGPNVI